MSRKNLIIIIIVFIAFIIGAIFLFGSRNPSGTNATSTTSGTSPFGGETSGNRFINTGASTTSSTGGENVSSINPQVLSQIYANPVSGSVFSINKNKQDVLRLIDRATGNAYEYIAGSGIDPIRITNTTIPKIEEALWSPLTDNVVLRYLDNDTDTIKTFSGKIKTSSGTSSVPGEITGTFLASNIDQLIIDPLGTKVFGLFEKKDGSGSYGVTTLFDGTGKKQIFDSKISLWNISWPKENTITFTTKSSSQYDGYLFFFNTETRTMSKIMANISGLSTLTNNNLSKVAYSKISDGKPILGIYDVKNKTVEFESIPTLADKCVWGNKNNNILYCAVPKNIAADNYPDVWYQGLSGFSDDIWMMDTAAGINKILYQTGINETDIIDGVDLKISPDDSYLSFSNKNDLSLWLLNVKDASASAINIGD